MATRKKPAAPVEEAPVEESPPAEQAPVADAPVSFDARPFLVRLATILRDDLSGDHPQARAHVDALLADLEG